MAWMVLGALVVPAAGGCGSGGRGTQDEDASILDAAPPVDASTDGALPDANTDAEIGGDAGADSGTDPDAGSDAGPVVDCTGGPRRYAYYTTGPVLHWLAPHGTGVLATGVTPTQSFGFDEADVDVTGHVTARRTSIVYVDAGRLMRVDGAAPCAEPPAPVQLSALTDVAQICSATPISDQADRSQSRLLFRYRDASGSCGGAAGAALPTWSVPLEGDASTAPTAVVAGAVPVVDPMGSVVAVVAAEPDGGLARITSLTNAAVAKTLVPTNLALGPIAYPLATAIGNGRYAITLDRTNTGTTELYVYDSVADTITASRGTFGGAPALDASARDATHLYFTAAPLGGAYGVYRLALDGSATAQLLVGSSAMNFYAVRVLGVRGSTLYYLQPGASLLDVRTQPTSIDFAAPPAAGTLVTGVGNVVFRFSTNRLLYANGNLAASIGLDGMHEATFDGGTPLDPPLSRWLGCTVGAADDVIDPVGVVPCERILLTATQGATSNTWVSFDADAGGDATTSLFASATRDEQLLGSFTGYAGTYSGPTRRAAPYLQLGFPVSSTIGGSVRLGLIASTDLATPPGWLVVLDAATSSSWLLP